MPNKHHILLKMAELWLDQYSVEAFDNHVDELKEVLEELVRKRQGIASLRWLYEHPMPPSTR